MSKKISLISFFILAVGLTIFLSFGHAIGSSSSNAVVPEELKPEFAKICSGNGGINCSIIRADGFVVCNDGKINQSNLIYAIPECHETLTRIADQESELMAKSGCYPPSEMGCFEEKSFSNLSARLKSSGLLNSELGKEELSQCHSQITEYNRKNIDYKLCLIQNGQSQINYSGKTILPILKAAFCPIFYGDKSSYDYDSDLCICDSDSFMFNGRCTDQSLICRTKYGSGVSAENGNCLCQTGYQFDQIKTSCIKTTPVPTHKPAVTYLPKITITQPTTRTENNNTFYSPKPTIPTPNISPEMNYENSSFIGKLINSFKTAFRNMLKLI